MKFIKYLFITILIIILTLIISIPILKNLFDKCNQSIDKPIIYLYPKEASNISVNLDFDGELICTYPEYNNGWNVQAYPDGTIKDLSTNKEYYALFWEGKSDYNYNMTKGFVVKGSETAQFLEKTLNTLGLNDKEANEFIIYWLPKMQNNKYNLITFQDIDYINNAKLTITPKPDSIIRVFMTYKALDNYIEIPPQDLKPAKRVGFTVVEWGGSCIE